MQLPSAVSASVGWLAYEFSRLQPFIPMYFHLIISAIFPIYAGAHSSLSRPSSAAKRDKKRKKKDGWDNDTDDEDDEPLRMEGLSPTDALIFPILAGCTLVGLYFLIKWLQDPAILNKILNWYFATYSVFSVAKLVSDGLDVFHSLVFPHDYLDRGVLYRVKPKLKRAIPSIPSSMPRAQPLPAPFSRLPLPQRLADLLWVLYVLPARKVHVKVYVRRFLDLRFGLGIHGIEGLVAGLATVAWYNFVNKPWFLTNIMGFGFAYGTLQILSPTTFWTGSLILCGLFFYDIYFVFFTPVMVTVAKSLDVPVKLLFPRPADPVVDTEMPPPEMSLSMLGLGDIVLPGIMIGLALRFDLFLFYLKKQVKSNAKASRQPSTPKRRSASSSRSPSSRSPSSRSPSSRSSASSPSKARDPESVKEDSTKHSKDVIKAPYVSVAESWGDRFWTSSLFTGYRSPTSTAPRYIARNAFPKPYFHASLVGYLVGMITTLAAMQISDHAQPALLYLVPGVLAALWGTAWLRGETKEMWAFSDASEEDVQSSSSQKTKNAKGKDSKSGDQTTQDKNDAKESAAAKTELAGRDEPVAGRTRAQRKSFFSSERNEARVKKIEDAVAKSSKGQSGESDGDKENEGKWFSFSLTLPSISPTDSASKSKSQNDTGDSPRYGLRSMDRGDEHATKRQRVR